ncbi:acyl-CoA reductase-like NAD-dependent aldehyde dehydrogenase [Ureibacillus xyleni]|uniref:Acyl-CoA reductase-like NAD-dependent aldehyde dehydrogenase n=1 Tax=Ureibacillus xyleni TaxID=614648 RepID=A0A285TQ61_9BACL|nr:aldehyde dehydrogenase family protein [Ureibacillus xyleni]SOC25231.1 acyl-CoA reductase-like NAD-dependent aldehyde dehydrogenase [Ureibacillus xyleni]
MRKNLYINGHWEEGENYSELKSPYSREVIAEIAQASTVQVNKAVDSAQEAFSKMKRLSSFERSTILDQLVNLLTANKDKAAEIISLESAKPLKFSIAEVDRTIETYKFAAEEAKRISGEVLPIDAAKNGVNKIGFTIHEPIGVIAAITPFNFPMNLVAHKVGPAIAAGNTIVLKPASQTPLSAIFLAELLAQTDLPKGAFNLVTGSGRVVGDALVEHEKVKMVTFTGSPEVGKNIKTKAGLKRVSLELGSNAGLIIDKEVDIDSIIDKCVNAAFSNQGQVCISLQRIYVHEQIIEEFTRKFKERTDQLVLGDPLDINTDISALISEGDLSRAKTWIDEAITEGAVLTTGGVIENQVLRPTILSNVGNTSKVSCQEAFAPVVTVNKISSVDEAIQQINDSIFGLQAGIFTNNIANASQAIKHLEVGGVIINDVPTFRVDHMPYGGVKESGNCREGIKYAIEEMTELKLVVWNHN